MDSAESELIINLAEIDTDVETRCIAGTSDWARAVTVLLAGVEEFGDRLGGGANIPTVMNLDQVGTSG